MYFKSTKMNIDTTNVFKSNLRKTDNVKIFF